MSAAIRQIAEIAGVSEEQAAETLTTIETQPEVMRELLLRRIAEAWLEGQRRAYRRMLGTRQIVPGTMGS